MHLPLVNIAHEQEKTPHSETRDESIIGDCAAIKRVAHMRHLTVTGRSPNSKTLSPIAVFIELQGYVESRGVFALLRLAVLTDNIAVIIKDSHGKFAYPLGLKHIVVYVGVTQGIHHQTGMDILNRGSRIAPMSDTALLITLDFFIFRGHIIADFIEIELGCSAIGSSSVGNGNIVLIHSYAIKGCFLNQLDRAVKLKHLQVGIFLTVKLTGKIIERIRLTIISLLCLTCAEHGENQ